MKTEHHWENAYSPLPTWYSCPLFADPPFSLHASTLTAILFLQDAAFPQRTKFNVYNLTFSRCPQTQACMVVICGSATPASLLPLNLNPRTSPVPSHFIYCVPRFLSLLPCTATISIALHHQLCLSLVFPGHQTQTQWRGLFPWRPLIFLYCHHRL